MRRNLRLDRLLEAHHGEELLRERVAAEAVTRAAPGRVLGYRNEIMWMKVTQSREVGEEEEVGAPVD
jgi:hypothetical protein